MATCIACYDSFAVALNGRRIERLAEVKEPPPADHRHIVLLTPGSVFD